MINNKLEYVLKRIQDNDLKLLQIIVDQGPVWHGKIKRLFGEDNAKLMLLRLRGRGLVSPIRHPNGYYRYDISKLGIEVLRYSKEKEVNA
jgi:chromosome segregation and condensation protein ScpB